MMNNRRVTGRFAHFDTLQAHWIHLGTFQKKLRETGPGARGSRIRTDGLFHLGPFFFPVASGVLFLIAWFVPSAAVLMSVALVPLFLFADRYGTSLKRLFSGGMLFGIIAFGPTIGYFFRTAPLTWMGIPDRGLSIFLIGVAWILTASVLALGPALWMVAFSRFGRSDMSDIPFAASLWVLLEFLRAYGVALLWMGRSEPIGPYWTYGFIGLPMADIPYVLPLASWGGLTILGFVTVALNAAVAYGIGRYPADDKKLERVGIPAVILALLLLPVPASLKGPEGAGQPVTVGVVGTDESREPGISRGSRQESYVEIRSLLGKMRDSGTVPDLLVFPEDTGFMDFLGPEYRTTVLPRNFVGGGPVVIDSKTISVGEGSRLALTFYDGYGVATSVYLKRFIVPFGEYLPDAFRFIGGMLGKDAWSARYLYQPEYVADTGGKSIPMGEVRGVKVAALLCSEMMTDEFYGRAVRDGAGILVNSSSQSWFRGSPSLVSETMRRARIFAAEHHRYFLLSGNMVPSFIIGPDGVLRDSAPAGRTSVIVDEIRPYSGLTPYDWLRGVTDILFFLPAVYIIGFSLGSCYHGRHGISAKQKRNICVSE